MLRFSKSPVTVNRSGVNVATYPLFRGVVYAFMLLYVLWHLVIDRAVVGMTASAVMSIWFSILLATVSRFTLATW